MVDEISVYLTFLTLFISTLFVNKYVLSVLEFQYPSIFQGWQSYVAVVVLLVLRRYRRLCMFKNGLTRTQLFFCLPLLCAHTASIYTGSKALASLSVPMFLVLSSLCHLSELFFDFTKAPTPPKMITAANYFGVMAVVFSSVMASETDPDLSNHYVGYYWMSLHVVSTFAASFLNRLRQRGTAILTEVDMLFLKSCFSVIVLLPFSFYLGDALAAQKFQYLYFYRFYAGCVVSGVCGVLLHILCINLNQRYQDAPAQDGVFEETPPLVIFSMHQLVGFSKMVAAFLSIFVFSALSNVENCFWIVCSLATSSIQANMGAGGGSVGGGGNSAASVTSVGAGGGSLPLVDLAPRASKRLSPPGALPSVGGGDSAVGAGGGDGGGAPKHHPSLAPPPSPRPSSTRSDLEAGDGGAVGGSCVVAGRSVVNVGGYGGSDGGFSRSGGGFNDSGDSYSGSGGGYSGGGDIYSGSGGGYSDSGGGYIPNGGGHIRSSGACSGGGGRRSGTGVSHIDGSLGEREGGSNVSCGGYSGSGAQGPGTGCVAGRTGGGSGGSGGGRMNTTAAIGNSPPTPTHKQKFVALRASS